MIYASEHAIKRFRQRVCDEFDVDTTKQIIENLALNARVLPDKGRGGFHVRQYDEPLCQFLCTRDAGDHRVIVVKTVLGPKEIEIAPKVEAFHNSITPLVAGIVIAKAKTEIKRMTRAELARFVRALVDEKFNEEIDARLDRFLEKQCTEQTRAQ